MVFVFKGPKKSVVYWYQSRRGIVEQLVQKVNQANDSQMFSSSGDHDIDADATRIFAKIK